MKLFFTFLFATILSFSFAQSLLQSGPMLGYVQMAEAMLWVQTTQAAEVQIEYWDADNPKSLQETDKIRTEKTHGFAVHLIADKLEPGKKYEYRLFINEKEAKRPYPLTFQTPKLWQYRTDPPATKIALGSCAYVNEEIYDRPGKAYGGNYEIFTAIAKEKPDVMLWLGDNLYLREVDWYSKTGIIHRYTHTRSLPEMQPLLASSINLAIWDDHDYGPNDSDRSFVGKEMTREVFKDFWCNPTCGVQEQGTASFFEWLDVQFFLLDDRWFRSPNEMVSRPREYLGKEQLDRLIESLIGSKATFKFVCVGGQVLNPVAKFETMISVSPTERDTLLSRIAKEDIKNVVFLTGDRHHSELSTIELKNPEGKSLKVYDWTVSPFTSSPHDAEKEENTLRVKGSHYGQRNFGTLEVSGPRKERKLVMKLMDVAGKEVWKQELTAE